MPLAIGLKPMAASGAPAARAGHPSRRGQAKRGDFFGNCDFRNAIWSARANDAARHRPQADGGIGSARSAGWASEPPRSGEARRLLRQLRFQEHPLVGEGERCRSPSASSRWRHRERPQRGLGIRAAAVRRSAATFSATAISGTPSGRRGRTMPLAIGLKPMAASGAPAARAGHPSRRGQAKRGDFFGNCDFRNAIWSARMFRFDRIRCSIQLGRYGTASSGIPACCGVLLPLRELQW
jgi:hypothetical protein